MIDGPREYGLEFLLAFDGRIHHLEEGYWIKFEIERIKATKERPHQFQDTETLIDDFFDEVERVLAQRGIGSTVVEVEETRRSK